jgi:hypothetical protein
MPGFLNAGYGDLSFLESPDYYLIFLIYFPDLLFFTYERLDIRYQTICHT